MILCTDLTLRCHDSHPRVSTSLCLQAKKHVTKGLAKTDVYLLDPDNGINAFQLSEDNWSQDALTWAEGYMNVKTLPVDAATATPIGIAASQQRYIGLNLSHGLRSILRAHEDMLRYSCLLELNCFV